MLMAHSDVWNLGKDNVVLRMKANSFSRVQHYFPECFVIVSDLEAHVQEAENLMLPRRKAQVEMKDGEVYVHTKDIKALTRKPSCTRLWTC